MAESQGYDKAKVRFVHGGPGLFVAEFKTGTHSRQLVDFPLAFDMAYTASPNSGCGAIAGSAIYWWYAEYHGYEQLRDAIGSYDWVDLADHLYDDMNSAIWGTSPTKWADGMRTHANTHAGFNFTTQSVNSRASDYYSTFKSEISAGRPAGVYIGRNATVTDDFHVGSARLGVKAGLAAWTATSMEGLALDTAAVRLVKATGFLVATIVGLVAIQYLYEWLMPSQLDVGALWVSSFNPFTYPVAFWLTHLVLTTVLLGGLAWVFNLRGGRLIRYLLLMYLISLLGPLWTFVGDIILTPARPPH